MGDAVSRTGSIEWLEWLRWVSLIRHAERLSYSGGNGEVVTLKGFGKARNCAIHAYQDGIYRDLMNYINFNECIQTSGRAGISVL